MNTSQCDTIRHQLPLLSLASGNLHIYPCYTASIAIVYLCSIYPNYLFASSQSMNCNHLFHNFVRLLLSANWNITFCSIIRIIIWKWYNTDLLTCESQTICWVFFFAQLVLSLNNNAIRGDPASSYLLSVFCWVKLCCSSIGIIPFYVIFVLVFDVAPFSTGLKEAGRKQEVHAQGFSGDRLPHGGIQWFNDMLLYRTVQWNYFFFAYNLVKS